MIRAMGLGSVAPVAQWLGCHRIELDDCESTNDEAARLARAGARHGTVVIARAQRAGRGRDGRAWASPRDAGLYLSAVLRPPLPLVDVPPMTLAIGVGLCDAVRITGAPAMLKWPNDVLVHGRKLAGVLVEAHSHGSRLDAVIVGIGVNLAAGALPPELAERAITLADALALRRDEPARETRGGGEWSGSAGPVASHRERSLSGPEVPGKVPSINVREGFIAQLLVQVERWVDRYVASGLAVIAPAWRERMATGISARARVGAIELCGEVTGLDGDGALVLRDAAGALHRVRSGDVEVIKPTAGSDAEPPASAC